MADFVFNIAKGRVAELYNRVEGNDPAASALVVILVATIGLQTDAVLMDLDDIAAVFAGTTDEISSVGYARKILTDVELAAIPAPDDALDRNERDFPDQTFTGMTGGLVIAKVIVAYDSDTAAGTDANLVPLTCHDFTMTIDTGVDVLVQTPNGFFRAA